MENNRYLLDTHIFIWSMEKNKRLPDNLINLIENPRNDIFLSVVTVWEMIIKKARKKLRFSKNIESEIKTVGFQLLSIELKHIMAIEALPNYHQDPFDRLILAQSQVENLPLITSDKKMWKYDVALLKA